LKRKYRGGKNSQPYVIKGRVFEEEHRKEKEVLLFTGEQGKKEVQSRVRGKVWKRRGAERHQLKVQGEGSVREGNFGLILAGCF